MAKKVFNSSANSTCPFDKLKLKNTIAYYTIQII